MVIGQEKEVRNMVTRNVSTSWDFQESLKNIRNSELTDRPLDKNISREALDFSFGRAKRAMYIFCYNLHAIFARDFMWKCDYFHWITNTVKETHVVDILWYKRYPYLRKCGFTTKITPSPHIFDFKSTMNFPKFFRKLRTLVFPENPKVWSWTCMLASNTCEFDLKAVCVSEFPR